MNYPFAIKYHRSQEGIAFYGLYLDGQCVFEGTWTECKQRELNQLAL